jgi:hypothetical protein
VWDNLVAPARRTMDNGVKIMKMSMFVVGESQYVVDTLGVFCLV